MHISEAGRPVVLFAVVFDVSTDCEVLLRSRVREELERCDDNELSVTRGLARAGRLIMNAGALLVVVGGALITSESLLMKTLGVGTAPAVGLDATLVRALLAPATMRRMGRWRWWSPGPLTQL